MDAQGKLSLVKTILGISASDTSQDEELSAYLDMAGEEILNWMYTNKPTKRATVNEVPRKYNMTQIHAVVNGFSQKGAEGEEVHNENGINRTFKYDDMISYIRAKVFQVI